MNKFQKILLGAFCGGVLLCGLGAGVAFTEFSSLAYGGEKLLGEESLTTENIDVAFEPGENRYDVCSYDYREAYREILEDENVPENTVRFEVTYNTATVDPIPYVDEENQIVVLDWNWHSSREVEYLMEAKDVLLAELKEGKISSYRTESVKEVRILVNPATAEKVHLIL